MRHLLNTLFVTTENAYLTLDGENVAIVQGGKTIGRFPLHILDGIVAFTYSGASPALMGACVKRDIELSFCTPNGKFLARVNGMSNGNVLLRRKQYRVADSDFESCAVAKNMIAGKIYNSRQIIERTRRDHKMRIDDEKLALASRSLRDILKTIPAVTDLETLRGYEGSASKIYFDVFDDMILNNKDIFRFNTRNKRPPMDCVNAMLSFTYMILASECASALESVGLDCYVGFMHRDRPGRKSLSLDLMEEFRSCMADRIVLTLINTGEMKENDFEKYESGRVLLNSSGRAKVLKSWQSKKATEIIHPYLDEKMPWGLVPYYQALLLARYLRGDLDAYPTFLYK